MLPRYLLSHCICDNAKRICASCSVSLQHELNAVRNKSESAKMIGDLQKKLTEVNIELSALKVWLIVANTVVYGV